MSTTATNNTVSVFCAPPNGRNPGMSSVDLAFESVAAAAGASEVRYWRLWDQSEWLCPPGGSHAESGGFLDEVTGVSYEKVRGRLDEFLDARAIVFWGDFLHMAVYLRDNVDVLTRRMRTFSATSDAGHFVSQYLLLKGQQDDVLSRVLSFGTTLSFNTTADYASEYGGELRSFLSRTRRVWHRDAYSAAVAQEMRSPEEQTCKGVDAAFLLVGGESPERGDRLGVFIGRSNLSPEFVAALGRSLSARLDLHPFWIPWGHEPAFWPMRQRRRLRLSWPGLERAAVPTFAERSTGLIDAVRGSRIADEPVGLSALFSQLGSCSVVLTDTYHLAVNAWRLGTPAVCIVDTASPAWSVNSGEPGSSRDKRIDLYSQIEALPLVVDGSASRGSLPAVCDRLVNYLRDPALIAVSHTRIRESTANARGMVVRELKELLESS